MKKLSREQILQIIKKELRAHQKLLVGLKVRVTSSLGTSDLVAVLADINGTTAAIVTLEGVWDAIREKESKL